MKTFILNFFDYNVYSLKNNELKIKYRYDFGVKNMPDDLLEVSDPASFMQKIAKDKSVQQIENFTETRNWITFDARYPVYYNKNAQVYYVFNELKFPYSLFVSLENLTSKDPLRTDAQKFTQNQAKAVPDPSSL